MANLESNLPFWLAPFGFPVFFVTMWLAVTTVLSYASGWYRLMRHYPDQIEESLLTLRNQSGSIGPVSASRILNLYVCPSGLRLGMMRIFGLFSRPVFIPWGDLHVTRKNKWYGRVARLDFGSPAVGNMTLASEIADALARGAGSRWPEPGSFPVEDGDQAAKRIFKQWLITTALAASFFTIVPRLMSPNGAAPPILVAILFPAIVLGVGSVFRYFTRRRT